MEAINSNTLDLDLQFELMEDIIAPGATRDFLEGFAAGAGTAAAAVGVVAGIIALT
ncbi:hypothetical protein M3181_18535 [Mesobacillus maritimus]|uniref:hypothetical protein n=1 Tax=Mesobacillus maritimus TaxID=1643336 RepID=UPI002041FCE0|nr:hypothetical protein [Mesobacillus maritimus]MCM3670962.1 hypothetical protein [Mesobacillus maritimus]